MAEAFQHRWLYIARGDVETERLQCRQEGRELSSLAAEFDRVAALDLEAPSNQPAAQALLDRSIELPMRGDFPYVEPSDLEGIRAQRPPGVKLPAVRARALSDKVLGAWLGRCCGCLLGKPVEGHRRDTLWPYLKATKQWPLTRYISARAPARTLRKYGMSPQRAFRETIRCMPEDDDTNYTVAGLAILAKHGRTFTSDDVAAFWLNELPILHTCTAERVAYRNLATGIAPPRSAVLRNPYREWIGAQIRADFFGYACPGDPERAAELAWRDARVSHVRNGVYGEMWAAAMIAAAFACDDPRTILRAGLAQVPSRSRLAEAVGAVISWDAEGAGYDQAVDRVHAAWDENRSHDWCHTISNAMIVAVGLLWGELDFGRSIGRAVQACFDTDCNGATVGSVVGAVLGAKALPKTWTSPLRDTLWTGLAGYHRVRISELAKRTMALIGVKRS